MVTVLNTSPAVVQIKMNSANTAIIIIIDSRTSGATLRPAACLRSSGTNARYANPVSTQTTAGSRKAPRHPINEVNAAVMPAASATPTLPHTPLSASVRPRLVAAATTMAVPTG